MSLSMESTAPAFPIVRHPPPGRRVPVLVSIPHYGGRPLPGVDDGHFAEPHFRTFPRGYVDAFAAELYGDLHEAGATVLATPYSRLFVDLNRARHDFELVDGIVRSRRGVVRTHIVGERAIFARPLSPEQVEQRLSAWYDPWHQALDRLCDDMLGREGHGLVLDAHTASEKGLGGHQIVIGTRRGETAPPRLAGCVAAVFRRHGFEVHHDVPGYAGAHIVRRLGRDGPPALHAIQVEVNSGLLMTGTRREYFERIDRGERPPVDDDVLARLRACLRELVREAGEALAGEA